MVSTFETSYRGWWLWLLSHKLIKFLRACLSSQKLLSLLCRVCK
jgi:hypothetical protein